MNIDNRDQYGDIWIVNKALEVIESCRDLIPEKINGKLTGRDIPRNHFGTYKAIEFFCNIDKSKIRLADIDMDKRRTIVGLCCYGKRSGISDMLLKDIANFIESHSMFGFLDRCKLNRTHVELMIDET